MGLTPSFHGRAPFYTDFRQGTHTLLVAVDCILPGIIVPLRALLDVGSQWCVLPPDIAQAVGCDLDEDPNEPPMHSRFGWLKGGNCSR